MCILEAISLLQIFPFLRSLPSLPSLTYNGKLLIVEQLEQLDVIMRRVWHLLFDKHYLLLYWKYYLKFDIYYLPFDTYYLQFDKYYFLFNKYYLLFNKYCLICEKYYLLFEKYYLRLCYEDVMKTVLDCTVCYTILFAEAIQQQAYSKSTILFAILQRPDPLCRRGQQMCILYKILFAEKH